MRRLIFLILVLSCFSAFEGSKILAFFTLPWKSHQFVFHRLIRKLGEKGHLVDFYTTMPMSDPPKGVRQFQVADTLMEALGKIGKEQNVSQDPFTLVNRGYDLVYYTIEKSFSTGNEFTDLLRSNNTYDIVLTESPCYAEPHAYLSHKFNSLSVYFTPMLDHPWTREMSRGPDNPSYMLSYLSRTGNKMNFFQRISNFFTTYVVKIVCHWNTIGRAQALADRYIKYEGWESRPPLIDVLSNASLVLANSHPSFAYPIPQAPHVKEIGGLHLLPTKPLPKDIETFMDEASNGVIYFSLGTNADAKALMETGLYQIFTNVFKGLKQRVAWKINPGMPQVHDENIKMQTWYPQQDVLEHKNVVLFITHGGLHSMVEAINSGIPTLTIPLFFDQFKDASYMKDIGVGLELSFDNITESTLLWTINELLDNPKYRQNAKQRQAMFRDRPMQPLDEAVYWIEYVARYGQVLQPKSVQMPFYQLYLLDVAATVIIAIVVTYYITKKLIISIPYKLTCCSNKKIEKEKST